LTSPLISSPVVTEYAINTTDFTGSPVVGAVDSAAAIELPALDSTTTKVTVTLAPGTEYVCIYTEYYGETRTSKIKVDHPTESDFIIEPYLSLSSDLNTTDKKFKLFGKGCLKKLAGDIDLFLSTGDSGANKVYVTKFVIHSACPPYCKTCSGTDTTCIDCHPGYFGSVILKDGNNCICGTLDSQCTLEHNDFGIVKTCTNKSAVTGSNSKIEFCEGLIPDNTKITVYDFNVADLTLSNSPVYPDYCLKITATDNYRGKKCICDLPQFSSTPSPTTNFMILIPTIEDSMGVISVKMTFDARAELTGIDWDRYYMQVSLVDDSGNKTILDSMGDYIQGTLVHGGQASITLSETNYKDKCTENTANVLYTCYFLAEVIDQCPNTYQVKFYHFAEAIFEILGPNVEVKIGNAFLDPADLNEDTCEDTEENRKSCYISPRYIFSGSFCTVEGSPCTPISYSSL